MARQGSTLGLLMLLFFCCFPAVRAGVLIEGCVHDDTGKYAEVDLEQGRQVSFTCTGISPDRTVEWSVGYSRDGAFTLGSCPSPDGPQPVSSCSSADEEQVLLSRPSPTESRMTIIKQSQARQLLENKTLYCRELPNVSVDNCPVDIIKPAGGTCKAEFVTSSHPWQVRVHCDVTSGNSTRNRYKCMFYQTIKEGVSDIPLTGWTSMVGDSLPRTCQMTVPLNISTPQNYRVLLMPGNRVFRADFQGSNEIRRPDPPRIKCKPDGWVPENSNLSCVCTASHLGLPEGQLRWSKGSGGHFDTEDPLKLRKTGFNQSKVIIPVTRQDNHKKQLRCDVVWAQNVTGPVKNVTVGYPASRVTLTINGGQPVSENSPATFTCTANDGLPPPHVILRKKVAGSKILANTTTPLDHTESHVQCEDSGLYTCTAGNGMGPDKMVEATLSVTCAPRDISRHIDPVYYQEKEIQFSFDVVANPFPSLVEFSFMGAVEEKANATSEVKDISLSGRCGRKEGGEVYMATCNVTVHNVTSQKAAGIYRGTVQNEAGNLTFEFEVKVNATIPEPATAGNLMAAGIGGSVAVALIIIIVIVVVVVRRRKQGSGKTKASGGDGGVRYTATPTSEARAIGADRDREPPHRPHQNSEHRQPLLMEDEGQGQDDSNVYVNVDPRGREGGGGGRGEGAAAAAATPPPPLGGDGGGGGKGGDGDTPAELYAVVQKKKTTTTTSSPTTTKKKKKEKKEKKTSGAKPHRQQEGKGPEGSNPNSGTAPPQPQLQQSQPQQQEEDGNNLYAVVNKKTKPPATATTTTTPAATATAAATAAAPTSSSPSPLSSVVPPATVPRNRGKKKGGDGGGGGGAAEKEDSTLSDPVYGNIDVQKHVARNPGNASSSTTSGGNSTPDTTTAAAAAAPHARGQVNDDGLLYVSVDFTDRTPTTTSGAQRPVVKPSEESVLYSTVEFARNASPAL